MVREQWNLWRFSGLWQISVLIVEGGKQDRKSATGERKQKTGINEEGMVEDYRPSIKFAAKQADTRPIGFFFNSCQFLAFASEFFIWWIFNFFCLHAFSFCGEGRAAYTTALSNQYNTVLKLQFTTQIMLINKIKSRRSQFSTTRFQSLVHEQQYAYAMS